MFKPPSLATVNIPAVESFDTADKKPVESMPSNFSESAAIPLNIAFETVVLMLVPGPIVGNPDKATAGVNVASLEVIEIIVSSTKFLTTTWSVPSVSSTVSTIEPEVPEPAVNAGPTKIHCVPSYTLSCAFVVSNHKSPVTVLVGALPLAVADPKFLNCEPL